MAVTCSSSWDRGQWNASFVVLRAKAAALHAAAHGLNREGCELPSRSAALLASKPLVRAPRVPGPPFLFALARARLPRPADHDALAAWVLELCLLPYVTKFVESAKQLADVLTKALRPGPHAQAVDALLWRPTSSS